MGNERLEAKGLGSSVGREGRERRPSANAKRGNVLGSICLCCSLLDGTCLTRCRLGGLAIAHYNDAPVHFLAAAF